MKLEHSLGTLDYVVMIISLLVPSAVGIVFKVTGGRQKTMDEYFLAGKSAPKFPVIMSASVSVMSSVLFIGGPAEVYRFGILYCCLSVPVILGIFISSYIFIPVYMQCNISIIYEFLEMRFGKLTKFTVSSMFILQMVLYASSVLYGPALVVNYVSGISIDLSVILCGGICTFYCFLGGLKAVLWTDVFQMLLMFSSLFILHIIGILEIGASEVYRRSVAGGRVDFLEFSLDLSKRYTVWNVLARGLGFSLGFFGTSQIQVQRFLSLGECKKAQSSFQWSSIPVAALLWFGASSGIVLYAVFYLCDPVLNSSETGITKYDQLVPYFIVTRLLPIPGLAGLCIAGIFSASLSTTSSALNTLSMVTVIDFIQPLFLTRFTEKTLLLIGKLLSLVYGTVFVFLTFAISKTDSITHVAIVFVGLVEGPILAVFLIGVLTRKASDKVMVTSLLLGFIIIGWIGLGAVFYGGGQTTSLPLETSNCLKANSSILSTRNSNSTCINSQGCDPDENQNTSVTEVFFLYKIASFWIGFLGCVSTITVALMLILITDWKRNVIPADSKCLSPIVRSK